MIHSHRADEFYRKPEGVSVKSSPNAQIFNKVRRDPKLWGDSWKYRKYYLSWINDKCKNGAVLKPCAGEVRRYGTTSNVQHLMCRKEWTPRPGKNIYLRTNLFHNWRGRLKFLGTQEQRRYPYFNYFMYDPLAESQFYFRWYAFASLMTTWATAIYPPQATLSLSRAAEKATYIEYHKRYNTIL